MWVVAGGELRGQRGVGDGGFEREALGVPGDFGVLVDEAAGLAVGAVRAEQDGRGEGARAVRGLHGEGDAGGGFFERDEAFDFEQRGALREGLVEAELVEALADGHGGDGRVGFYADFAVRRVGRGLLQDDLVADALDDGVNGVAERGERLAREAAGAGLGAREVAAVQQGERACRRGRGRKLRRNRRDRRRR